MDKVSSETIIRLIREQSNNAQREILMRFFKTGAGQYGEGDKFLGLKVPQTRTIVNSVKHKVPLAEIEVLLNSEWHEVRLAALLLLTEEMKANLPKSKDSRATVDAKKLKREEMAKFYIEHSDRANNWDLVDISCEFILGPYLRIDSEETTPILLELANSANLWKQRIAIVTTLDFIRNGIYGPTFILVDYLHSHPHDLIHKALGWMLREIGKRDKDSLISYLEANYKRLHRTTLRYAIERFPEPERKSWLQRK